MTDDGGRSIETPARTGATAVLVVPPFRLVRVVAPALWDPGAGPLPVSWEIRDPHRRIRRGHLIVTVSGPNWERMINHVVRLSPEQLRSGIHSLPLPDQWDGTLLSSMSGRAGTRITGEMSKIYATVTVWSTDSEAPAPVPEREVTESHVPGSAVPTERQGEWLARMAAVVDLDTVVSARWGRSYCVPYPASPTLFPIERSLGDVAIRVRVKNVLEGTPVRIDVTRITDPADPGSDYPYLEAPYEQAQQPGLFDLVVSGGRVRRAGGAERLPFVRFNQYEEHWAYPGNNFYCFRIGFGQTGSPTAASPRDPIADEEACLHMRFTVFIHSPARNLPWARAEGIDLRRLINRTRYHHAFLQGSDQVDAEKLLASYRHRYLVVFNGHGGLYCGHDSHPNLPAAGLDTGTEYRGLSEQQREERARFGEATEPGPNLAILTEGFAPDQDICPPPTSMDNAGRAELQDLEEYQRRRYWRRWYPDRWRSMHFGWCLHREGLQHCLDLGPVDGAARNGLDLWGPSGDLRGRNPRVDSLLFGLEQPAPAPEGSDTPGRRQRRRRARPPRDRWSNPMLPKELPRLALFADGCRTRLSTTFAAAVCGAGTRFYHGWHYSVLDDVGLMREFFTRWLPMAGPGMPEADPEQLRAAYRAAAADPFRASFHPRLMESLESLPPGESPGNAARALH